MKVALVTTSPSIRSGIGDYTRHLLPYLREHCEVRIFVEPRAEGAEDATPVDGLDPRDHDRVLFQLGNEQAHGFMPRMIRVIGGTVMLHDYVLFDMALAAWPGLARGGVKGHALALREGGPRQMRVYMQNWLDRRDQRRTPQAAVDCEELPGNMLCGWHEMEENGRWTSDCACLRIPSPSVRSVEVLVHPEAGRRVRLTEGGRTLAELGRGRGQILAAVPNPAMPVLRIETSGIRVTKEQRANGDSRRLGSFVRAVRWEDDSGWRGFDLSEPATIPIHPVTLARDRFDLALNRSVVRFADSFIAHSRHVAERILRDRNAHTPIGILHHGAEMRWLDKDRRLTRRRMGLPQEWVDAFLVVSFGGLQRHKRIDKVLEGIARARQERDDIRILLVGRMDSGEFDAQRYAKKLGVLDAVRFTGFAEEEECWDWLHAGDVCINLRGPSSGGTSGGIFQSLSLGRPVIASDAEEQKELPDSCIVKVPLGPGEVAELARTLVALRNDPERRAELERASREFVESECHWSITARQYAEYLERFPRPRVTRRKLFALSLAIEKARRTAP